MSQSQNLTIYLKESGNSYNLQYCYNQNSTFDDLLESFSYNYPDLKICPCYKIEYHNNNDYSKVNMTDKVINYMSSYTQYQLVKENNECTCDEFIKNYFWKSKLELIKKINEYSKEVNKLEKEINENKSNNQLFKQLENQNQANSQLQNDNNILKNKNENIKEDNSSLEVKIKELNKEIERNRIELNKKKEDFLNLEKENKDLQEQIFRVEGKNDNLVNKIGMAIKEIKELKQEIENKEKKEKELIRQIIKLMEENEKLREGKEIEKTNIDFYDVIVDIKSVKDISQGWEIKMNENFRPKYE